MTMNVLHVAYNCEGSPDNQSNGLSHIHTHTHTYTHTHTHTHAHTHRGPKDFTRPVNFVLSEKRLNEEEEEGDVDSDLDDEVSSY